MADINIEETLGKLTLSEKIGLLAGIDFWHTYPVHRLGIPSLRVSDGPNGVRGTKFFNAVPSACFPCGTGLAATFNADLLQEAGQLMGDEGKHKSAHVILGPTTNIARGPNGGRGFESFSEDPYLAGIASAAVINGIQDKDLVATIKHFVGNDLEDQRNASDSIITERALREIYLEPFRLAVKYSQPKAFMTGYNKVNGEHISQSERILKEILTKEWGFDGTIMSDWYGTYTTSNSIENGLDLEMPGPPKFRTDALVTHQIQTRELHINDVNDRVRNVLKLIKNTAKAGVKENGPEDSDNDTAETAELLRKVAGESVVLLKNKNDILPLKKDEKIAVIGPNAKYAAYCGGGSASLTAYHTVSPYEGITAKLGKEPAYTVGAYAHQSLPALSEQVTNSSNNKRGFRTRFYSEDPTDKPDAEAFDDLHVAQSSIFLADYKHPKIKDDLYWIVFEGDLTVDETADYEFGLAVIGTGQLFVDGKLVVDNKTKQTRGNVFFGCGTVEERGTLKLEQGKKYAVKVIFGSAPTYTITGDDVVDFGGGGGLKTGVAKVIDPKEEIARAVKIAKESDKVVLNIGLNQEWESEGFDRPDLDLPGYTNDLVAAVLDANPNTVVVNQSGTPVEFPWLSKANALVHAWFGGNEAGHAIADVLFGDVNPSGKLSLSWPFKFSDNPAYLNFKTERGRVLYGEDVFVGYRYYEKLQRQVAFPFGYGLSYTNFEFANLKVSADEKNDKLTITVDVKNTGKIDGQEVVQVYIAPVNPTIIRPVKELKGFAKTAVKAGSSSTAKIELDLKDSVSFFDEYENKWSQEKGEYEVQVGASSDDIELIEKFEIKETKLWLGL